MTRRGRRLTIIGAAGVVLAAAAALALTAMRETIVFFRAPSEVAAATVPTGKRFRLGGMVDAGSVVRSPDQMVEFRIGDGAASVPVRYRGLLPDLFREGQGVVTEGVLSAGGVFVADTVLARHDESYMPREVADALKAQGRWREGAGAQPARTAGP